MKKAVLLTLLFLLPFTTGCADFKHRMCNSPDTYVGGATIRLLADIETEAIGQNGRDRDLGKRGIEIQNVLNQKLFPIDCSE